MYDAPQPDPLNLPHRRRLPPIDLIIITLHPQLHCILPHCLTALTPRLAHATTPLRLREPQLPLLSATPLIPLFSWRLWPLLAQSAAVVTHTIGNVALEPRRLDSIKGVVLQFPFIFFSSSLHMHSLFVLFVCQYRYLSSFG